MSSGTFLWDHSLTQVYYSNWASGEPNNQEGEDCAVKYLNGGQYQWNDLPCDDLNCKALCQ